MVSIFYSLLMLGPEFDVASTPPAIIPSTPASGGTNESLSLLSKMSEPVKPKQCLGAVKLFAILFVGCIGGAYGVEDVVGSVGPLLAILFIATLPWILQVTSSCIIA